MRYLILTILLTAPLYACCPVDKDSFADEVPDVSVINEIAGMVPRLPADYWQERLKRAEKAGSPAFERDLEMALCQDQLDLQEAGLDRLQEWVSKDLKQPDRDRLNRLRMEIAMDLWWRGGTERYPAADCLKLAQAALAGPDKDLMQHVIDWAKAGNEADPTRYLPDFFDLRYATDKTTDHDVGELRNRGLENAEAFLLGEVKRHSAWENFDTFYSLNLVYVVQGRQNLAYYARLRAWRMHADGQYSKTPGASQIEDIKPLTILRQFKAGVLVPVKVVSDENQAEAKRQFKARQAYAEKWSLARDQFFVQQQAAGIDVQDPHFWDDFAPPPQDFPPLVKTAPKADVQPPADKPKPAPQAAPAPARDKSPESEAKRKDSRTVTLITLAILVGLLVLGTLVKMRVTRAASTEEEPQS